MKNTTFILLLLLSYYTRAQVEAGLLLGLTQATTTDISAIDTNLISEGTLIYSKTLKKVLGFMDGQWRIIGEYTPNVTVVSKTSDYTAQLSDNGFVLAFNSATDVSLIIPSGFPIGYHLSVYQIGNGKVLFTGLGTTLKNRLERYKTAGKDAGVGIIATATDQYHLTGDLRK